MKTRTRVFFALAIAVVLMAVAVSFLLSGWVSTAIWMEGPYFLLTLILPGSMDTLWTMAVGVAAYYFVASLVALTASSRRSVVFVVLIVIALNTLGVLAWRGQHSHSSSAHDQAVQQVLQAGEAPHRS